MRELTVLMAKSLQLWGRRHWYWVELASPSCAAVSENRARKILFEFTGLSLSFFYADAAEVGFKRLEIILSVWISGIRANEEPNIRVEFVLPYAPPIFQENAEPILRLRKTLFSGFLEPFRRQGILLSFQSDHPQQILSEGIALYSGFLEP